MSASTSPSSTSRPRIVIAASEHPRLQSLAERALERSAPMGEYLAEELSRAQILPDEQFSPHVVRMGSAVKYRDDAAQRTREVQLVYPHEADIERQRVSVLTPIGAALIGLSPGQSIDWPTPDGRTATLTVLEVRNGDEVNRDS
jgi:regulator of nucleoside diphosphate kinase